MKKALLSVFALAVLMIASAVGYAQTTYTLVTSANGLEAGAEYLIVGFNEDGSAYAMGYQKTNNRHAVTVTATNGTILAVVASDVNSQTDPFAFTLGGSTGAWTLFDPLKEGYLNAPGGGNYLKTQTELTDNGRWTIDIADDGSCMPVSNGGVEQCYMRYNPNSSGNPLFSCYKESSSVNNPVYFFKAGETVVNPEPTNYPTAFAASVSGLNIDLTWTDATGDQLPYKYLVLASTGNITVPVDGTPVDNGDMAINVNYGDETVSFNGLESNTTYHFAIFPYSNAGDDIDYKTDGNYPTVTATTEVVNILLSENFDTDLGEFISINVVGDEQMWVQATYNNNGYAYMNGYSGAAIENEDWLVSPAINGDFPVITMSFRNAKNFNGEALKVMISNDYVGSGNPTSYEWEDISDLFEWSTGSYAWVSSGEANIGSLVGLTFYVAFVYNSTTEGAAAWEVDDVMLMGAQNVEVAEASEDALMVAPNPANDNIRFVLNQSAQVSVFDLSGRMLANHQMVEGEHTLTVSQYENGIYFLNVRYADGQKEIVRFVKF